MEPDATRSASRQTLLNPFGARPALIVVAGPPGSGKTSYCLDRFADSPEDTLIVFPTAGQREAAERALRASRRWTEALEFHADSLQEWSRLVAYVIDHGTSARPAVAGRLSRVAVAARVADETPAGFFENARQTLGFHERLADVLEELAGSGLTPDRLSEAARRAEVADPRFPEKADSLAALWRAQEELLDRLGLTTSARLPAEAADVLEAVGLDAGQVWFDGFHRLTQLQMELIALLAVDRRVGITLQCRDGAEALFRQSERMLRRLEERFEIVRVDVSDEPVRYRGDTMRTLASRLFRDDTPVGPADEPVWVVDCPNRLAEAEWVARWILRLREEQGADEDDFLIVARDMDAYWPVLRAALPRYGLEPARAEDRVCVENPFVRFLLSVLALIRDDWPREAVYQHIASTYAFDHGEHWALRAALRGSRTRHGLEFWRARAKKLAEEGCVPAVRLAALADRSESFTGAKTPAEFARLLRETATDLGWTDRAGDRNAPHHQDDFWAAKTADDAAVALDRIESAGSDGTMRLAQFTAQWSRILRLARYTVCSRGSGQPIPVVENPEEVSFTPKVAFVLGLIEGQFPRRPHEDPFLMDEERRELRRIAGCYLLTGEERAEDERLRFYLAAVLPSERLFLFYPRAGEEREAIPTLYLDEVRRALPPLAVREQTVLLAPPPSAVEPSQLAPPPDFALTPEDRMLCAAAGIYGGLEAARRDNPEVDGLLTAWQVLPSFPRVERQDAAEMAGRKPGAISVTELDALNRCFFQHWARYRARIQAWAAGISRMEQGTIIHEVLRDAVERSGPPPELERLVARLDARLEELDLEGHDWEVELLRAWAVRLLTGFARREAAYRRAYGLAPRRLEWCFGEPPNEERERDPSSSPQPIQVEALGASVAVAGSVDRIDEGDGRTVVTDYKLGGTDRLRREMAELHSLQLPLYALAVDERLRAGRAVVGYDCLEAETRQLIVPAESRGEWEERAEEAATEVSAFAEGEWGELLDEVRRRVVELVSRLESAEVTPDPSEDTCRLCPYGDLCRTKGRRRHDGAPWEDPDAPGS